jgi:LysM repeat protein
MHHITGMKNILFFSLLFSLIVPAALQAVPVDSLGVEVIDGKQVVRHKVEAGETWFSISRKYGVPYAELRLANKGAAESLKVGQVLNVPSKAKPTDPSNQKNYMDKPAPVAPVKTETATVKPAPVSAPSAAQAGSKQHKVAPGETVYRISKMYNVKPADLCAWNNIKNNSIEPGQVLVIKGVGGTADPAPVVEKPKAPALSPAPEKTKPVPVAPVAPAVAPAKEPKVVVTEAEPLPKTTGSNFEFAKNRKEIQETGEADRIYDEPVNPNKYYALHATAPIGTIIMVRNLANDRTVFVKVVGRLEDTDSNRNLVIKLSRASSEQIKAPNKRFKVELLYGMGVPKVR